MKITKRQLRRLIESVLHEQQSGPPAYANKAEEEHAKQLENEKDRKLIFQILNTIYAFSRATGKGTIMMPRRYEGDESNIEELNNDIKDLMGSRSMDKVFLNNIGHAHMESDFEGRILGLRGDLSNLGDYLNDLIGYDRLTSYPELYALYQENV